MYPCMIYSEWCNRWLLVEWMVLTEWNPLILKNLTWNLAMEVRKVTFHWKGSRWGFMVPVSFRWSSFNLDVDVSENRGAPKPSILIGFSIINHPFWGTTIFGIHHVSRWISFFLGSVLRSPHFPKTWGSEGAVMGPICLEGEWKIVEMSGFFPVFKTSLAWKVVWKILKTVENFTWSHVTNEPDSKLILKKASVSVHRRLDATSRRRREVHGWPMSSSSMRM